MKEIMDKDDNVEERDQRTPTPLSPTHHPHPTPGRT